MWGKLTHHIGSSFSWPPIISGAWLGFEEPSRPMRPSCSLSVLHNTHFTVVRPSKSSDNLHKVTTFETTRRREKKQSESPPVKKNSLFNLKRSKDKKGRRKKEMELANADGPSTSEPSDSGDFTRSWHTNASMPSNSSSVKNIFQILRSSHQNETVLVSRTCPSSQTINDFSQLRKRRPRSAHFDPNTLILPRYEEVPQEKVDELYTRIEKLGEGSYATVYKCESKLDGSIVALKQIKLQFQEGLPFTAIREASLLKTLRHANIVCLHDIFHQEDQLTFVFEYMVVTLWYRPPDVLLGSTTYSTSLDMWGVGCILAEMATGHALFPGSRDFNDQLRTIFAVRGTPDPTVWREVRELPHYDALRYAPISELPFTTVDPALGRLQNGLELLSMLLQLNPASRVPASLALLHPFFAALPSAVHLLQPHQSIFALSELQFLRRMKSYS